MFSPAVELGHDDRIRAIHFSRDPIGWVDAEVYRQYLASESYGSERIVVAEDNRRVRACAVWYGARPSDINLILDCLWVDSDVGDRAALGAAVMQAGHAAFKSRGSRILPEYHLFLKPDWQKDPDTSVEVEWRRDAAVTAGLTHKIERLRYEWTRDAGIEEPSGRLVCSPEPDDDVFLDVFGRVAIGKPRSRTRDVVAKLGVHGHASATLACYRGMRGDRAWWRMAYTPNGKLVGFAIPRANEDNPVIGYLGVVPEMRGRGYAAELLAEATRHPRRAGRRAHSGRH